MVQQTFLDAVVELCNPAQLEVLARARPLANEQLHAAGASDDSE